MREQDDPMREPAAGAVREASTADPFWRLIGAGAVVGGLMAFFGPLGTHDLPVWTRIAYWPPIILIGTLIGYGMTRWSQSWDWLPQRSIWRAPVMATLVSAPMTAVVLLANQAMLGVVVSPPAWLALFAIVWVISAAMTALSSLIVTAHKAEIMAFHPAPEPAAPAAAPSPRVRFLDRLPEKIRGGALYALEAEDHYLRAHTSKGSDLILMRMADAEAELEGEEGLRVHRSWWVARAGVAAARRDGDRIILTLKSGAEAPVSRANASAVRAAGWV
jgi:hypothetical protein